MCAVLSREVLVISKVVEMTRKMLQTPNSYRVSIRVSIMKFSTPNAGLENRCKKVARMDTSQYESFLPLIVSL
jgi:hypothetical protein